MELVRPVAKAENKLKEGTPAQLYSFFVEKCKKNLHIVLAFSPIGDAFRTRVRMFPSIVNCWVQSRWKKISERNASKWCNFITPVPANGQRNFYRNLKDTTM